MGYLEDLRARTPDAPPSDFAIERSILRQWRREWSVNGSPWDTTWTDHMLAYAAITLPRIDHHEFFIRQIHSIEDTFWINRRKIVNWIGSRSSGKTDSFATVAQLLLSIDPEFSRAFFAAPYKTAAESVGWGRMKTRTAMIKLNSEFAQVESSKDRIVYLDGPESGYIELMTLDKVGKLQGAKSLDPLRGFFILICDEVALFPSQALLDIIENIMENDNLLILTGCNFKDTEGLEGRLCQPEGREYSDLDIDLDQEWLSDYGSKTWRFDGMLSPNILANKVIYPYLLKPETVATSIATHGERGPKVLEQIRSFPNTNSSDFYITTPTKVESSGAKQAFTYSEVATSKVAFCDPGFGGDPCKIGAFQWGKAKIPTSDGAFHETEIFEPCGPIETIKVQSGITADARWIERITEALGESGSEAKGLIGVRLGGILEMEVQIAVQCSEFIKKMDIPHSHFGFDGSLRADLVQAMIAVMGGSVSALDYNKPPTERVSSFGKTHMDEDGNMRSRLAKEEFTNFNTEIHFAFANLIQAGQLRGADLIPTAIKQVCGRRWSWKAQKKKIQTKEEYKDNNSQRSPDDSDVMVSALEMARRNGFRILNDRKPPETSSQGGFLDLFKNAALTRIKTAKKLRR